MFLSILFSFTFLFRTYLSVFSLFLCELVRKTKSVFIYLPIVLTVVFIYFFYLFFDIEDNGISTHVLCYIQSPCVCGFVNSVICSHRHIMAYSFEKHCHCLYLSLCVSSVFSCIRLNLPLSVCQNNNKNQYMYESYHKRLL